MRIIMKTIKIIGLLMLMVVVNSLLHSLVPGGGERTLLVAIMYGTLYYLIYKIIRN